MEQENYTVYIIGGDRDGEDLADFAEERDAVAFAERYWKAHEEELDPVWGGVGVIDNRTGLPVTW